MNWYRKAAEQGFAEAQYNLGVCYNNGHGITQDYKQAVRWYRKAAEQGHARAQHNLGASYVNGEGVLEDYVQAYKWFNIASTNGLEEGSLNSKRERFSPLAATVARCLLHVPGQ